MSRSTELINRPAPVEQAYEMAKSQAEALLQIRGANVTETNPHALNSMIRTLVVLRMKTQKLCHKCADEPEKLH